MTANYMVLEATRAYSGDRFPVATGERKVIRFGYDNPAFVPRIVEQARRGKQIIWGGATVLADGYQILFDDCGPLPREFRSAL